MDKWTKEEIDFLKKNYPQRSLKEISKILNKTEHIVRYKVRKLGIQKIFYKRETDIKIIDCYSRGNSISRTAVICHATKKTIRLILKNNNIKQRDKENQNSLAKLDLSKWECRNNELQPNLSKDLFYIFGILYGDGDISLCKTKKGHIHYKVELSANDKPFVQEFIKSLKEIGISHSGWIFLEKKKNPKWNDTYKTRAYCKVFAEWFNKNIDLKWIKNNATEPSYKLYFIRGIYESEGSLLNNNGYKCIEIVNTDEKLMQLTKEFIEVFGFNPTLRVAKRIKKRKKDKKPIYKIGLYRDKEVQNLLNLIKPCIQRKAVF